MRTNVADTSIEVYRSEIRGHKENCENHLVLKHIEKHFPCTGRQISQGTGIENSAVARSLNNLKKSEKIEAMFVAKCKITGRQAQHYIIFKP
jgi:predicted ArsR family transcriptional regulator